MTITDEIKLLILALTAITLFGCIAYIERKVSEKVPEIYLEKPYVPAKIIINTNNSFGEIRPVWRALAQGGEEPGRRMLYPTVDLLSKIKPSYIRIDHMFDDEYYGVVRGRNPDRSLKLDWSILDKTVDDILATGAKPFFSLTYMPYAIAGSKIGIPDWQDWQDLIRQTVDYYSSKIPDVYYEVWNEPSLPAFGTWRMYEPKDYRQLYYFAVMGAELANPTYNFKIGGPAIPELDSRWIELLFDYVLEHNLRLDFISWHRYHYDPAKFLEDVYKINVLTSDPKYEQFSSLEKIISEWGPNSYKDAVYSSQVAASHLVSVVRKLLDKVIWAFTFEVKDGPGQGNYGWGLLSHENSGVYPKPRYYLFDWLADLSGQRVEILGEGSNVTGFAVREGRTVTSILTNYNPYSPYDESFQVSFSQLGGGRYRLLIQQLFNNPEERIVEVNTDSLIVNVNLPAYETVKLQLTKIAGYERETAGFASVFYDIEADRF